MSKFQKFQIHPSTKAPMGGVVTAVTLAFSPFTSYVKESDGRLKPNDCLDFRILDTIARFYNITVSPQGELSPNLSHCSLPRRWILRNPRMVSGEGRWRTGLGLEWWQFLFFLFQKCLILGCWQFCFPNFLRFITFVFGWEPWKKGRLTSRWTWLWLAQERKWSTTLWHT